MPILNDADFQVALDATDAVLPRSLWTHLNGIAQYLALIGATGEALAVWKFAYSGLVLVPEQDTAFGDCSVSALCHHVRHPDLSQGRPRSSFTQPNNDLEQRLADLDREMRRGLTQDSWAPTATLEHIELARRARALARPLTGERFASSETEALAHLEAYIAHPKAQGHAILASHLLYADIDLRHAMPEQARQHLRDWADKAKTQSVFLEEVFGLYTTAFLALTGTLASLSSLTSAERSARVEAWLQKLSVRLLAPYQASPAATEVHVNVFDSMLSFEPAIDGSWEGEWQLLGGEVSPPPAPDGAYPHLVSIATPEETGSCLVTVEHPSTVPSHEAADYAIAFPLRVVPNDSQASVQGRIGTLFPNTPTGEKGDMGLEVPPGEHDVLARFFLIEEDEIFLRHWRVILSFLPRGTLAPGILKPEARAT